MVTPQDRPQTHTILVFGQCSGWCRFGVCCMSICFRDCQSVISLGSGSRKSRGEIFWTCSKDPSPTICRWANGVRSGTMRERIGISGEHAECIRSSVGLITRDVVGFNAKLSRAAVSRTECETKLILYWMHAGWIFFARHQTEPNRTPLDTKPNIAESCLNSVCINSDKKSIHNRPEEKQRHYINCQLSF